MSENKFEWTDSLVKEYTVYFNTYFNTNEKRLAYGGESIFEEFKRSKAIQRDIPKDFEVGTRVMDTWHSNTIYTLNENGLWSNGGLDNFTISSGEIAYNKRYQFLDEPVNINKYIPKDWEIVSFEYEGLYWDIWKGHFNELAAPVWKPKNYSTEPVYIIKVPEKSNIISVRRISDKEVFENGGTYGHKDYSENYRFTINEFYIRHTGILACKGLSDIYPIDFSIENWVKVKPKVPLFTTGNNVCIYENDSYYGVDFGFNIVPMKASASIEYSLYETRTFSTKQIAENWVLEHKPIQVSLNEIKKVFENYGDYTYFKAVCSYLNQFFLSKINP